VAVPPSRHRLVGKTSPLLLTSFLVPSRQRLVGKTSPLLLTSFLVPMLLKMVCNSALLLPTMRVSLLLPPPPPPPLLRLLSLPEVSGLPRLPATPWLEGWAPVSLLRTALAVQAARQG